MWQVCPQYQYIKVNAEPSGNVSASAFSNPSNKRIKGLRTVKISVNQVPPTLFTPSVKLISKKSFSYPYLIPRYHPHYQGKFQLYKWQVSGTVSKPSIRYLGVKYQVPSIRYQVPLYQVCSCHPACGPSLTVGLTQCWQSRHHLQRSAPIPGVDGCIILSTWLKLTLAVYTVHSCWHLLSHYFPISWQRIELPTTALCPRLTNTKEWERRGRAAGFVGTKGPPAAVSPTLW